MGLEICGGKDELWTETEILEGWEIPKCSFEVQGKVLRVFINPKLILKTFWTSPDPFRQSFIYFSMIFNENH